MFVSDNINYEKENGGTTWTLRERTYCQEKHPIYSVDIERYRKTLKIGQQVRIKVREWNSDFKYQVVHQKCVVEEKHRWLFLARDQRGKRYAVTYVDMIIQGACREE